MKQPATGVGDAVAGGGRRWTGDLEDDSRSAEGTFGDRLGDSVGVGLLSRRIAQGWSTFFTAIFEPLFRSGLLCECQVGTNFRAKNTFPVEWWMLCVYVKNGAIFSTWRKSKTN